MRRVAVVLWLIFISHACLAENAVTYFRGSRFGDCVLAYLHAKWVSYIYKIPFVYQPFKYSDQLILHTLEKIEQGFVFDKKIKLRSGQPLLDFVNEIKASHNCLGLIRYFPEYRYELVKNRYPYFSVNWRDKIFHILVRQLIRPRFSLMLNQIPRDKITVALHVRKGGGFDSLHVMQVLPLKFPPDSFYIEQLRKVSEYFGHKPIYAYIFTDDSEPQNIAEKYRRMLKLANVIIDYRRTTNSWNCNVLADFFSLMKFDVLIRPDSNFSYVAALIHTFKLEIWPEHFRRQGVTVIIDKTGFGLHTSDFDTENF